MSVKPPSQINGDFTMKNLLFTLTFTLTSSAFATETVVPVEVKSAFCDALEYAMQHPDDFDNDIYSCRNGYQRNLCLNGKFRRYSKTFVSASLKKITCDCGAKLKRNEKGTLIGRITGCA